MQLLLLATIAPEELPLYVGDRWSALARRGLLRNQHWSHWRRPGQGSVSSRKLHFTDMGRRQAPMTTVSGAQ